MLPQLSRRNLMTLTVGAAMSALARGSLSAFGFAEEAAGEEPIPFLDAEKLKPAKGGMVDWNELASDEWLTPNKRIYHVSHYGVAQVKAEEHKLSLTGLFDKPITLTVDQIKSRPRIERVLTLECGGNGAGDQFCGAVANAKWAGTPLAPILKEAGLKEDAVEVAFFGADKGKEKIRNNDVEQHFARALSIRNALREDVFLCYEMNGEPLTQGHGFPLRLVVPGWYGIAWVKWLTTIEARERALMTRFMAKDYVTLRGEPQADGKVIWKETSVGPMNVKSMTARAVRRKDGTVVFNGAAWTDGTPLKTVEVKIDDGEWQPATLAEQQKYCWTFWTYQWKDAKAGEHTVVSRATDAKGRVQPSEDDPAIKLKKTYWEANQQWPRKIKI
jgi:DMSO/TMAO reductase YedYZ molybdopterin-dependent catalytic subunit